MFNHQDVPFVPIERESIDGVRYYKVFGTEELVRMPSITSVISWRNRNKFKEWRKKVGEETADKITKQATSRGTDMHTLVEHLLKNETLPDVQPLSQFLFKIAKPELNKINNIYALESSLYSKYFSHHSYFWKYFKFLNSRLLSIYWNKSKISFH